MEEWEAEEDMKMQVEVESENVGLKCKDTLC